ncbi:hypothetical protein [Companilactobacillus kimchiensis]|uniref:YolD-like protein n=1 Tax=Companilactobacillus kimchiensis TaxID=993692 RepID=A0A0R2LJS5_9LACO|nr:hypothetical protein [Companilactobacillus kimchiensis]KRO00396.1 hypothetical protein IV57_GL001500 [Companilactobacillus kimchiensis]
MNSKYDTDTEMVQTFFDSYYHERDKMKLTDNRSTVNQQDNPKHKQSDEQITKFLMQSFTYNQIIKVKLNRNSERKTDLTGEVSDYNDDLFHLDNGKKFRLAEVKNIEIVA